MSARLLFTGLRQISEDKMPSEEPRPFALAQIESASVDDVAAIQSTAAESWRAAYGGFMSDEKIDDFQARWYNAESIKRSVESRNTIFLVARVEGDLIGFSQAGISPRGGELYRIYLRPAWWGKRIGDLLLDSIEVWLREQGCAGYGCFVAGPNKIGRRFYERQGFVPKPELNDGEDLYLWKEL